MKIYESIVDWMMDQIGDDDFCTEDGSICMDLILMAAGDNLDFSPEALKTAADYVFEMITSQGTKAFWSDDE